jgi:hypothetical protein
MFMLRDALTHAVRGRGKTLVAGLGVAAALAGAGSASAVLTSGPATATHDSAAAHAAALTSHHVSASPVHVTPAKSATHAATGSATPASTTHAATGAAVPATAKAAATQPTPAQSQPTAAQPAAAPAAQPAAAPAQTQQQQQEQAPPVTQAASGPYQIYDSTTPSAIPAGQQAAVYSDGAYAAAPAQVAGHPGTIWIDTNGSNPSANALDVEPGDATPAQAGQWVAQKLTDTPDQVAIVYTMRSDWPAVQAAVGQLPPWMQSHVRWWIADPTGAPHMVPGASATQWYWGPDYDISTASPGF